MNPQTELAPTLTLPAECVERTYWLVGSNSRSRIPFLYVSVRDSHHLPNRLPDERPKVIWLPTKKPDLTKPKPKIGTVQLEWNKTGSLLLARYGQWVPPVCTERSHRKTHRECANSHPHIRVPLHVIKRDKPEPDGCPPVAKLIDPATAGSPGFLEPCTKRGSFDLYWQLQPLHME